MHERMRVLMVAGGTGGHVIPALVMAEELRARNRRAPIEQFEIEFVGTTRPLEARLIPAAGFPLRTVAAAGLKGMRGWRMIRNSWLLPRTFWEVAAILRAFRPHVVVGIGGYLAGPVMLEAYVLGIPTLLLEPNATPGFTNRILGPLVRKAAVGFERTAEFYGNKAVVTGPPVRKEFFAIPPKEHRCPFTVLIVGGSQGAKAINQAVIAGLPLLGPEKGRISFIHQTGEADYNGVRSAYRERDFNAQVHSFIEDMPGAFAQADLVISRSGATAVAELAAAGKAAILVPFPAAADQHQLENARVLERVGAARLIEQAALTPEKLVEEIRNLLSDAAGSTLCRMEKQARGVARPDAAARIADLIEKIAVSSQPSTISGQTES